MDLDPVELLVAAVLLLVAVPVVMAQLLVLLLLLKLGLLPEELVLLRVLQWVLSNL